MTDNRNRTASTVRSTFTKAGGNLGETGSVIKVPSPVCVRMLAIDPAR